MTVADTSYVIDLMRGDPGAIAALGVAEQEGWLIEVPSPVVHELFRGLVRSRRPVPEHQRISAALARLRMRPGDIATARLAGDIEGALWNAGTPIGPLDCMIAAAALQMGQPVITRDVDHFSRIDDLVVQTY